MSSPRYTLVEVAADNIQDVLDTLEASDLAWDTTKVETALERAWDDFDAADGTPGALRAYSRALDLIADATLVQAAEGGDYNRDLGPEEPLTDHTRTRDERYAREIAAAARALKTIGERLRTSPAAA